MSIQAGGLILGAALVAAGGAGAATVFTDSGATPADIQDTVDAFRDALGALNGNVPENFDGGRREVNWDGVPDEFSDPNPFPGDFFNGSTPGRARGIEFLPTGTSTGLSVSADSDNPTGTPIQFGDEDEYTVFSPERLFEATDGSTLDVIFFDPTDQVTEAFTLGFGAVFTGLVSDVAPTLTFYDARGNMIAQESEAIVVDEGLAFIGVVFDDPTVARVAIDVGDEAVMDDFIYGEPAPVPVPAAAVLLGGALAALAGLRRRKA